MKTILFILFLYFLYQVLRKTTGARGSTLPRIIEDDGPLPGPWNRRAGQEQDAPLPGPWDRPVETGAGDKPLPGPWDRKRKRETPVKTQPAGDTGCDYEPAPEPPRPKQAPPRETAPRERTPETRTRHEKPRCATGEGSFTGKHEQPPRHAEEKKADYQPGDRATASTQPQRRERRLRRRGKNPLEAVLCDKKTLVGGLVLGEVLGARGGRAAAKKGTHFHSR